MFLVNLSFLLSPSKMQIPSHSSESARSCGLATLGPSGLDQVDESRAEGKVLALMSWTFLGWKGSKVQIAGAAKKPKGSSLNPKPFLWLGKRILRSNGKENLSLPLCGQLG